MNPRVPQIQALEDIQRWLDSHPDYSDLINRAVFTTANKMRVHPNDIAIYILIRTASL